MMRDIRWRTGPIPLIGRDNANLTASVSVPSIMDACLAQGEYLGKTLVRRSIGTTIVTEAVYPSGAILPKHTHETATFCFVLRGAFQEQLEHHELIAEAGTMLYRPGGRWHSDVFLNQPARTLGIDLSSSSCLPNESFSIRSPQGSRLAAQLYQELRRDDDCSNVALDTLVLALQAEVTRASFNLAEKAPSWLWRVHARLTEDNQSPPSATELAQEAGVHPVHLSREFHRFFGCSVGQYIRYLRVTRARAKLIAEDRSIGEIALDVGFCDQAHFTKAFKEFTGQTPAEYRANRRLRR